MRFCDLPKFQLQVVNSVPRRVF